MPTTMNVYQKRRIIDKKCWRIGVICNSH